MKYINIDDYEKPDGSIDWEKYRKAQLDNGEICSKCSSYIVWRSTDGPSLCYECKQINKDLEEFSHSRFIICPFCKKSVDPSEIDHPSVAYEDGHHAFTCLDCEKEFEVETSVSFYYTSRKLDEDEIDGNNESGQ